MLRHRSKTDWWLAALIWGGLAFAAVGVFFGAQADIPNAALRLLIGLSPLAVTVALIYPLYYEIGEDRLLVRCGLVSYRIPGASIVSVRPTRNPLSAPAMSLDRLEIKYAPEGKQRMILISPQDQEAFYSDLRAIAPQLKRAGDRLAA